MQEGEGPAAAVAAGGRAIVVKDPRSPMSPLIVLRSLNFLVTYRRSRVFSGGDGQAVPEHKRRGGLRVRFGNTASGRRVGWRCIWCDRNRFAALTMQRHKTLSAAFVLAT